MIPVSKKDLIFLDEQDMGVISMVCKKVLEIEAYLPAYKLDNGGLAIYPEMDLPSVRDLLVDPANSDALEVIHAGKLIGVVPLMCPPDEEGMSGVVRHYYQVLRDDGSLILLRSLALNTPWLGIGRNFYSRLPEKVAPTNLWLDFVERKQNGML